MKAFLILGLLVTSSNVFAAKYEVPVTESLKKYATFELSDFEKRLDGDKMTVKYHLPSILTGNRERIKLQGRIEANSNETILIGAKGTAKCIGSYEQSVCTVSYDEMNIDEVRAVEAIRNISQSPEEFAGRVEVMRAFSTDPVGIITY